MEKKNVNFEDVVYFQEGPGVRNWQFRDSGIKLINIRNLVDSELCLENTTNYLEVEEVENKYKHFLLNAGDFVMASSGVTWGKIAEVHEEHLPLCLNTSIIRLVSKDTDVLDKWYLYYYIKSPQFRRQIERLITGSAQPNFGPSHLKKVVINLLEICNQREAVEQFTKVEAVINKRRKEIELLDDLIKARFVELFGNPVLNDKGWEQKPLGEISSKIGSGATPRGGKEAYQENGITLIRSMNVYNGQFEYKDLAHISDEQAGKLDNVTIEENDVLLNITGASVARCCVVPSEILPARVNQHVCIIRCKDCIIPEFLNKLLIDDNYQYLLWSIAGSGATREAITKQQVENLQIILPPLVLQNQFMEFCNQVDKSKVAVQKALDETQLLFDSLMHKYFG